MEYSITDSALVKGLNPGVLIQIQVFPLPENFKRDIEKSGLCKPSRCFDNSWAIVANSVIENAQYVLALGAKVLPVEHAIICVDGVYYDPTWELHLDGVGKDYYVIEQWNKNDLFHVAKQSAQSDGIYPPMLRNLEQNVVYKHLFCEQSVIK